MAEASTGNLSELADIVMPDPVSWWPPAAGWYWLATILLGLGIIHGVLTWRRWRQNAYRRRALVELEADDLTVNQLFGIIKRVALVSFGRSGVAPLSGADWIRFLDLTCRGLNTEDLRPLYAAVFSPRQSTGAEFQAGLQAARRWVRHHQPCQRLQPLNNEGSGLPA